MKFNVVVCGGTFDHFHKGHRVFLKHAFTIGKKVVIGVTSDKYVNKLKIKNEKLKIIEDFEKRKQAVLEFIKEKKVLNKTKIVKINDLFGPTLSKDFPIDAIVVSEDTKKGSDIINQARKELRLIPLKVLIAPFVRVEDGKLISATRIRNGEINREGKVYVKDEWFHKDLKLTENRRKELKKPFGALLKNDEELFVDKDHLVITVGDVTAKKFNEKSLGQKLSVIDFKVARKNKFSNISELGFTGNEKVFSVDNPAGSITSNLFKKIKEIFKDKIKDKIILRIYGEEDLAVLPLVLTAPLNTIIYYGQPGKGLVRVVVSSDTKDKAYNLVLKLKFA